MKKILCLFLIFAGFFVSPLAANAAGDGTITQLQQFTNDGTNITQRVANTPIKITGLSTGLCLTLSGGSVLTTTTCGTGGGGGGVGTSTEPFMAKYYVATSTLIASQFPYASTTALTATTLCLTGDICRSTWPTGGGSAWPFTPTTVGGVAYQGTTTPIIDFAGLDVGTSSNGLLVGGTTFGYASSTNTATTFGIGAGNAATTSATSLGLSAIGFKALYKNTIGAQDTAVGANALSANTTGSFNSAYGSGALSFNTTGYYNTAGGYLALGSNTTGGSNTVYGADADQLNSTGSSTSAFGFAAGATGSGPQNNDTFIGYFTNENVGSPVQDTTELGYQAGFNNTGFDSTFIGENGGQNNTSGNNNITLGFNALVPSPTASNQLNIGNIIFGTNLTATSSSASTIPTPVGSVSIGTSTPFYGLTIGTSTAPQLVLSDNISADNLWTFRNISNTLYIATSTALSTSTKAALVFNAINGSASFGSPATTTMTGGIQGTYLNLTGANAATSTSANGFNLTGGCFSVNGTCVTSGSGSSASSTLYIDNGTFAASTTYQSQLNLQGASSSLFTFGTGWGTAESLITPSTGLISVLKLQSSAASASEEPALDIGALGATTKPFGRISATAGSGFASPELRFWTDNGSGAISQRAFFNMNGVFTVGTTTIGNGLVTIGTSTIPQLALSDNNQADNQFVFRNVGNSFFFSTSTQSATNTIPVWAVNSNGTSTWQNGHNITSGCYSISGVCLTSGSGSPTSPAGSNSNIQLNSAGSFGATSGFSFDGTYLTVPGYLALASTSASNGAWILFGSTTVAFASTTNQDTIFGLDAGGNQATTSPTVRGDSLFGYQAGAGMTGGNLNALFGTFAGSVIGNGSNDTCIGYKCLKSVTGNRNTAVGDESLSSLSSGTDNSTLGYAAGLALNTTSFANIIIGAEVEAPKNPGNQQLNIGNVIYGTSMYSTLSGSSQPTKNGDIGIGTSTPWGKLAISFNSGDTATSSQFVIASSTPTATTTLFRIDNVGHFYASSTNPVISGCGTGPTFLGSDNWGEVIPGTAATGCTITFSTPWLNAPVCTVSNQSMSVVNAMTYAITSSALTITMTGIAGDKVDYICQGVAAN